MSSIATRMANSGVTSNTIDIIGDGNCFFRAVLVSIQTKNISGFGMPESQHMLLREMVVQAASVGKYCFDVFHMEYADQAEWVREMSQSGTWGDNIAIEACSDLLEIPIQIVSDGRIVISFGDRFYNKNQTTKIDNVIRLNLTMGHYSVVV